MIDSSSDPFDADLSAISCPMIEDDDDDQLNISNITIVNEQLYQEEMDGEEEGDEDEDDPLNTAFCIYSDDDD